MIEINEPHLLPQLLDRLEADGCSTESVGSHAGRVFHRDALDPHEALTEVRFFLTAWAQAHGDVAVSVRPAV